MLAKKSIYFLNKSTIRRILSRFFAVLRLFAPGPVRLGILQVQKAKIMVQNRGLNVIGIGLAVVVFAAFPATPAISCTVPYNANELIRELAHHINQERRHVNLNRFYMSPTLAKGAQIHACDNANHNRLSHFGTDGSSPGTRVLRVGYDFAVVTENVAIGYGRAKQVIEAWLQSYTHRKNIFEPRTDELGVAVARGRDGRLHWVMNAGLR